MSGIMIGAAIMLGVLGTTVQFLPLHQRDLQRARSVVMLAVVLALVAIALALNKT